MDFLTGPGSARVFDLAQPLQETTPTSPNHVPFRMALMRRHGDYIRADNSSAANELFTMSGHTGTHIDALCHVSLAGQLYGGVDALEAQRGARFKSLGIDSVAPILCRGVLLDVPRALGVESLEPAHRITADDLVLTAKAQGVDVHQGDAVLVRSGWPVDRFHDARAYIGFDSGVPGVDVSAASWLSSHGVRVTGADTLAYEWLAPGAGHSLLPVHIHLLVECGIHIIEVMNLEELAAARVHEFMFMAAPLRLVGATASPIRPLAIVW